MAPAGYGKGWTVRYTTELTDEVDFYAAWRGVLGAARPTAYGESPPRGYRDVDTSRRPVLPTEAAPRDVARLLTAARAVSILPMLKRAGKQSRPAGSGSAVTKRRTRAGPCARRDGGRRWTACLFGDNQFFGVNHMSEEKARAQQMRFQTIDAIMSCLTRPTTRV